MKLKYLILSILAAALGLNHANAQENEIVQTVSAQSLQASKCSETAISAKTEKCCQLAHSDTSADCIRENQMDHSFQCVRRAKLYRYTCTCGCHNHPVNNYSGLNALRSRLATKLALNPNDSSLLSATWILHLCGKTPGKTIGLHGSGADADLNTGTHDGEQNRLASGNGSNSLLGNSKGSLDKNDDSNKRGQNQDGDSGSNFSTSNHRSSLNSSNSINGSDSEMGESDANFNSALSSDSDATSGLDPKTISYLNAITAGEKPVGAPVYFFFKLAKAELTDPSQLLNLNAIATLAKEHNLKVRITGAADSATGTAALNAKLSQARAEYIATLLHSQGLTADRIIVTSSGGINTHSPVSANRHCKVELLVE